MLNSILPFAFPAPAVDTKISKDIALPEPIPIPEPDIIIPGGGTIPGISTGSGTTTKPATTTKAGATTNVDALSGLALKGLMSSGGSLPSISAPSAATSGADGNKSGDAYSTATFGDFIVNGSKGTSLGTFMIIGGSVIAVILTIKMLLRKK